jgi:transposase
MVARLTHQHSKLGVYGPDEAKAMFRVSMPGIEALVDGQVRPYRADLVLRSQSGKLVGAIVLLHKYLSRRTLDALAEAWSECTDVSEVIFYAIPDICEHLEQAIANVHSGAELRLKTIPLSRSARTRLNATKERDLRDKHDLEAEREREEWRKEWTSADPPFLELTDSEWEVLDPILSPRRRKEIHWKGLRLRNDRHIINTLLLASYLGRPLSVMTVFMGYESGVTCRGRLEDWRDAGVLADAWQKLADMSPHRALPSSDSLMSKDRQVDPRGLFNYPDWQEILRNDAIVWEGLERARTSGR